MKNTLYAILVALILASCGKDQAEEGPSLRLHLQLPHTLSKTSGRYKRFTDRVEYLEIILKSDGGEIYENHFPVSHWDNLILPTLQFPKTAADVLHVSARVWDRKKDGTKRAYPILEGTARLEAARFQAPGGGDLSLRLSLKISPENYDN
jgi:hypothetical protein